MRNIHWACALALLAGAFAFYPDGAAAQGNDAARQACTPDAMRLCADVVPDVARTTACMRRKYSQLSAECRLAMRGGSGEHRRTYRHHQYSGHKHCHHCG